jgi:hypothetical protein
MRRVKIMGTITSRKAIALSGRGLKAAEKAERRNKATAEFVKAAEGTENAALVMVSAFVRYLTTGATVEDTRKHLADSVKERGISNPSVYTGRAENGAAVSIALGVLPEDASELELAAIRNARNVTGPNGDQDQRREDIGALVSAVQEGTDPRKALTAVKAARKPSTPEPTEDVTPTPDVEDDAPEVEQDADRVNVGVVLSWMDDALNALGSLSKAERVRVAKDARRIVSAVEALNAKA